MILLKFWKESLLVLLAVALFAMWRSREKALVAKGVAQEKSRVADSILKVVTPKLAKADSAVLRGTVTVTQFVDRWSTDTAWRTDTVYVAGDTMPRIAVPVATVVRNDSTIKACNELRLDCTAFRAFANDKIAALETKLAAQPAAERRSCTVPMILSGLVGAVGGYTMPRSRPR